MTTLCALQEPDGTIWLGCDQQITSGDIVERVDFPKWELVRDPELPGQTCAVGWAGDICTGVVAVSLIAEWSAVAFTPSALADRMRRALDDLGWPKEDGQGEAPNRRAKLVVAMRGRLYDIDIATGYAEPIPAGLFRAWGTGRQFALGVAEALRGEPAQRLMVEAVRVAIEFDIYSGGDPWVACLAETPMAQR